MRRQPTFDDVASFAGLLSATGRARRANPGSAETLAYLADLESHTVALRDELRDGTYRPGPLRHFTIHEPKRRRISAAPFRDRVVHHALCAVLEPVFEGALTPHSFACRRGMGLHRAVSTAQRHLRRHPYALKCDIRHYFETVDHGLLQEAVARRIRDHEIRTLCGHIIANGMVSMNDGRPTGIPIGNLTSQHFANFHLARMDHWILRRLGNGAYVRYMDDLLMFGDDKAELWRVEDALATYLDERLRLTLKRSISAVYKHTVGVPFLGLRIFRGTVRLQGVARRRLIRKLGAARRALDSGRIDEATYQAKIGGLLGYALAADSVGLRRSVLERHRTCRSRRESRGTS